MIACLQSEPRALVRALQLGPEPSKTEILAGQIGFSPPIYPSANSWKNLMKILKDLLVACLNATLVLVAVCLFLLWQISGTAERITAEFANNLNVLTPISERISKLSEEVAGLREEVRQASVSEATRQKLNALETEAKRLNDTIENISNTPERLMQSSISTTADSVASVLTDLRGCGSPKGSS